MLGDGRRQGLVRSRIIIIWLPEVFWFVMLTALTSRQPSDACWLSEASMACASNAPRNMLSFSVITLYSVMAETVDAYWPSARTMSSVSASSAVLSSR